MLSHREGERERECLGKSQSSQCNVIKPSHIEKETASENCKRWKTKQHRIVSGITNNTCCFHAVSQLFETICRSNLAWQMFLLVLIEFKFKLETQLKICRISQMVSMKTPNSFLDIFLLNFEDDVIFLQNFDSILFSYFQGGKQAGHSSRNI